FLYLLGAAAIYFFQDNIIFQSEKVAKKHSYTISEPMQEVFIPVSTTDTLHLIRFFRADTLQEAKGLILFYHGNKKNINHYSKYASLFTRRGYDAIMMDYPNFGKSRGKIT